MERIYLFLIRNDVWIYILCFLGLVWYVNEFIRAQSALRRAMFNLERETSLRARNSAMLFITVFLAIVGLVIYVNVQVAPTLPPELLRPPTPTPDPFAFPASTAAPPTTAPTPTAPIAPTVTLSGDNLIASPVIPTSAITGTVAPATINPIELASPTVVVAGCTPTVNISDPRDGDIVVDTVSFFGNANIPGFGGYEIEIRGPQTNDRWASLLGRRVNQRVEDGLLATADLTTWTTGLYAVRLSVYNTASQLTNQCQISITLET